MLARYMAGFAVKRKNGFSTACSSFDRGTLRAGRASSRTGRTLSSTATMRCASLSPPVFRSEEHTSELQSLTNIVCRLLLEKKNYTRLNQYSPTSTVRLADKDPCVSRTV